MPDNEAFDGYQNREMDQRPVSRASTSLATQNGSALPGHVISVATEVTHLKPTAKQTYLSDNKVQIPEVETVSCLFMNLSKFPY